MSSKYKLNMKKFNNMSDEEKLKLVNDIKIDYCNNCLVRETVAKKYDMPISLLKHIIKIYSIKKTKEQKKESVKKHCLEKYGVESTNQLESVKKKQRETHMKRYGVPSPLSLYENRNKKAISQGYTNTFQIPEIKDKIKQQNIEKYGVEYVLQRPDIKEKVAKTNLKKYGCKCVMGSKQIRETIKKNNLKKYGVEYNWQIPEVKNKVIQTNLQKYGVPYFCMTEQCRHYSGAISKINMKFANILQEMNIKFEQEFNINNYSYDFKVGDILIEINPTYTHNSTKPALFSKTHNTLHPLDQNYHQNKSKLAQENGYRCIHVWDWDDWNKVINLLLPKEKIYARKCIIKEVSKKECDEFLNLYHLQNTCKGQNVRLGLYYNNELVQIMTFGKPRYNKKYEWELLRLCLHKNYIVIGGSQRLWKHFLNLYSPSNIISYCDNSKFSGKVYETLGMELIDFGSPSCNWSKGTHKITQNLLNQQGADRLIGTNDGKGTSNKEIMIREGWLEIYDCGQSVYNWINKQL